MKMKSVRFQQGFTMIELMVAVVIGLITVLIMNQALTVSEGYRRTSTSGGDAQVSGTLAMFLLQRDLRNAGYGVLASESDGSNIGITPLSLCGPPNKTRVYVGGATASPATVEMDGSNKPGFVHFAVYPAGSAIHDAIYGPPPASNAADYASDIIQVIYAGSSASVSTAVHAKEIYDAGIGAMALRMNPSRFGFRKGDLILVTTNAPVSVDGAAYLQPICMINEITGTPNSNTGGDPAGNSADLIRQNPVTYNTAKYCSDYIDNPVGSNNCSTKFSAVANPPPDATTHLLFNISLGASDKFTRVYNFGPRADIADVAAAPLPRFVARLYRIHQSRLESCDMLSTDCTSANGVWIPIADNIVSMRAVYGIDDGGNGGTANDGIVDTWTQNQPLSVATPTVRWEQVLSARISIVSRSRQYEKDAATTAASPAWAGDSANTTLHDTSWAASYPHDLSTLGSDWGHYRYRLFETTVPFRNLIWK